MSKKRKNGALNSAVSNIIVFPSDKLKFNPAKELTQAESDLDTLWEDVQKIYTTWDQEDPIRMNRILSLLSKNAELAMNKEWGND